MAFLPSFGSDLNPIIRSGNLLLRAPMMSDYAAWAELRAQSRAHLTPWEPRWSIDELSRAAYRHRVRHYMREARDDLGYAFFIFRNSDETLLGGLTLSNVRRGVSQAASLGYWMGAPYAGRGHMKSAAGALVDFAFDVHRLHRVEAACLPTNAASQKVLEANGFQREGLARRYLQINGQWQDHVLYACLSEDRPRSGGRRG